MFITEILLRSAGGAGRRAQGNIWLGKHRLRHGVTPVHTERLKKRIMLEERNLFYLRHPYLTVDQEHGHARALKKHEKWLNGRKVFDASVRVTPSIRMEDRLGFLNVSNRWEM